MIKIAVLKLGARITYGGTSGGSGEAIAIIDMLKNANIDVHAYTKILQKDTPLQNVKMHQILDEYKEINNLNYDALVVINGSVNYFGGYDSPEQTINYHIINNFNGPIYYIMCDPNLSLKQIWPSIEKKEWASNYKKEDIFITKQINYIIQARNTDKVKTDLLKNDIGIKSIVHYPFEKFPLLYNNTFNKKLSEKKYDLLYGGTFRGGKRQDDMIKFYFGLDEFNVAMFGNIKETDFNIKKTNNLSHPKYEQAVVYDKFNEKMSESIATVIIGDKYYKEISDLAQRIYESILAGVITFIDSSYDKDKIIFKNPKLQFLYVSSKEDLKIKLDKIKKLNDEQYQVLLNMQREDAFINIDEYCKSFANLIKG